jgi:hypothetical protein
MIKDPNDNPWVRAVEAKIANHCEKIAAEFKATARVTCLVRHVGDIAGSMDMIVTPDEMPQLLAMVLRRLSENESKALAEKIGKAVFQYIRMDDAGAPINCSEMGYGLAVLEAMSKP